VEEGGLAAARAARYEYVQAGHYRGFEEDHRFLGDGAEADKVVSGERHLAELADAHRWPVQAEGRDDAVNAGAVWEAGVHHGRSLVYVAAKGSHDAVDDAHHVLVVLEVDVGEGQLACLLYPYLGSAVDHDFC